MDIDLPISPSIDHFHRLVQHGQRLEAEKVELNQANLLHISHGVLGDNLSVLPAVKGKMFHQRLIGYNHTCCMGGGMSDQTLQGFGGVDQ